MNTYRKSALAAIGIALAGALLATSSLADNREFVQTDNENFAIAVADFTTLNPPRNAVELNWGDRWHGDVELSPGGRIVYYTHGFARYTMRCDVEDGDDEVRVDIKIDMNGLAEIRC